MFKGWPSKVSLENKVAKFASLKCVSKLGLLGWFMPIAAQLEGSPNCLGLLKDEKEWDPPILRQTDFGPEHYPFKNPDVTLLNGCTQKSSWLSKGLFLAQVRIGPRKISTLRPLHAAGELSPALCRPSRTSLSRSTS